MNKRVKLKRDVTYSVLLMRDDSPVRSLRMQRRTLRLLCVFLLLVFGVGVAGSLVAVRYMDRYYSLQQEFKVMQQQFTEARLHLEQLTNVKTLVEQTEGEVEPARNNEVGAEPQTLEATPGRNGLTANATALQRNASLIVGQSNATTPLPTEQAASVEAAPAVSEDSPFTSLPELTGAQMPIRIGGFTWRAQGDNRLRLRYDLSTQSGKQVSGVMHFYGIRKNGQAVPLTLEKEEDARFAISRMKPIEAVVMLPQGTPLSSLTELKVLVELEDGAKYQWTHRFSR